MLLKSQDAYYKKVAGGLIQAWHKDDAPDCFESDHIFLVYDCNMYTSGFPVCLTILRPSLISMLATMIEHIWNVARWKNVESLFCTTNILGKQLKSPVKVVSLVRMKTRGKHTSARGKIPFSSYLQWLVQNIAFF